MFLFYSSHVYHVSSIEIILNDLVSDALQGFLHSLQLNYTEGLLNAKLV